MVNHSRVAGALGRRLRPLAQTRIDSLARLSIVDHRLPLTSSGPLSPLVPARSPTPLLLQSRRTFHSSPARQDVVFLAIPALKSVLLTATRVTLVMLPFVWRWKLWHKYRRFSLALVQIPIFALCVIFALGLDQSPRTNRWRLLLMSEGEEHAWSSRRAHELVEDEGDLLLPPSDKRSSQVRAVLERILAAVEEEERDVLNIREIVSIPGGWKPTHNHAPGSHSYLNEGKERDTAKATPSNGEGEDEDDGPGCAIETDYLVDLEQKREQEAADAKLAALSRRARRRKQRQMREQLEDEEDEPDNVIEVRGWKVYLVESPEINALALPTKQIFVYSGLVDLLEDDDLLAAVLGHEVAHAIERHAVENMGFLNVATVLFDVVRGVTYALTLSFPVVTDGVALAINYINDVVAKRAYSRKLEMEADEVGLLLMSRAQYDPRAAYALWELMDAVEHDAVASGQRKATSFVDNLELMRTHPLGVERQQNIERLLPEALKLYKASVAKAAAAKSST